MELRGSRASLAVFALLRTRSKVTDRHLYMELVLLFHFIPSFQAVQEGPVLKGKSLLGLRVAGTLLPLVNPAEEHVAVLVAPERCLWRGRFPAFSPSFLWPRASFSALLPASPPQPPLTLPWFLC